MVKLSNLASRRILIILAVAAVLRLVSALPQDRLAPYQTTQGDTGWYLANGYALAIGMDNGRLPVPGTTDTTIPIALAGLPTAPLYLVWIGWMQRLFEPATAILMIRLLQAVMGTLTCYFAYRLAKVFSGHESAGLIAAGVLAISPVFILESAQILTETLYVFLIAGGLFCYSLAVPQGGSIVQAPKIRPLILAAILLGLGTLTRAVLLAFPLGLALHLLMVYGWKRAIKLVIILLAAYSLTVSTWTVFNLVKWNRFVVGADGLWSFLYIGASDTGWQGPTQADQSLAEQSGMGSEFPTDPDEQQALYQNAAVSSITRNLPGWLRLRFQKLTNAYLQPHGTVFYGGESLKEMVSTWASQDRSVAGLMRLTQGDAFWPKFLIYLFHFFGLLGGLIGMWLTRKNWRVTLPLIGFILYTSLAHFVLDAIPRYLFPTEFGWWVFASVTLALVLRRLTGRKPVAKLLESSDHAVQDSIGIT